MARFLFTVWPFPGHLHPNVAIAHALAARGHDAAFYTGESVVASLEREGFECFPFRRVSEARLNDIVLALDAMSLHWWRARRGKALLGEWLIGTADAQLEDLRPVVAAWRPGVLVCDPAMWGPLLVLQEIARLPLAIMSYVAACMLPGPEGPILGLPLGKPRNEFARAARRVLRSLADIASADIRRAAEALRARSGLPPIHTSVTAFAGEMPLYLVPSTPAYDRNRRDLPSSVRYVGPCQWDKPHTEFTPRWLEELPRDRPVVYVTEGTMHAKPPLVLRAALEGLSTAPVRVIATTGRHRDPGTLELGNIPPNARVERWVPHTDLLPRIDLVVTTGGTGTVLAALSAGVPLIVIPTAWDQPENAWRIAESGAGRRLAAGQCTPAQIRRSVDQVLRDPSFRQNAQRLATDFSNFGGASRAADLLEQLAATRNAPEEHASTVSLQPVSRSRTVPLVDAVSAVVPTENGSR